MAFVNVKYGFFAGKITQVNTSEALVADVAWTYLGGADEGHACDDVQLGKNLLQVFFHANDVLKQQHDAVLVQHGCQQLG